MATGTEEFIDVTTADVYLEEKLSQMCTIARQKNLVFANNVDRRFEQELKKGQILHIGNITHPTGRAKTTNTAITFETVTETESTITIDAYYYTAIALEDVITPMVSIDVLEKYIPGLGYGLYLLEDDGLAALVDDGTIIQTVGTLAVDITYKNLIRADQYLNDADVPQDARVILTSPAQKAGFLEMDYFINTDYTKVGASMNGLVGSWMNYPIYVSTNMDGDNTNGHDSVMMHKECIAHVEQIKPATRSWWDGDYQCVKMSSLMTWGNAIIRANHGVWLKGA